MESFVKWGREKRQLDEVLGKVLGTGAIGAGVAGAAITGGVLPAVGAMAVTGGVLYLWARGANRRDAHNDFWVYKRDAEGEKKKAFDGVSIVKMFDSGELKATDFFVPPGAQNWHKIGDDLKRHHAGKTDRWLPWDQSKSGGKIHTKVTDDTKWVAYIDGKRVTFPKTSDFVKAVRNREIEKDTHVWHDGYGQKWKKYSDRDVQSEIAPFVAKMGSAGDLPTMGDEKLLGAPAKYLIGGKVHHTTFEDLANLGLSDDTYVFVRKHKNAWLRYKEIKKLLPSVGQADELNPRGGLHNFGRWLAGHRTVDREDPKKDAWKDGKDKID